MNIEEMKNLMDLIEKHHERNEQAIIDGKLVGQKKQEYLRGAEQYEQMFDHLEEMKQLTNKPEAFENLMLQQHEILKKWVVLEGDCCADYV